MPSPFGLIGNLLQLSAIVLSTAFGFMEQPAMLSIPASGLLFSIGYALVRLPHMIGIYQRDGAKILLAFFYLLIGNCALAAILYAAGWAVSRLFS